MSPAGRRNNKARVYILIFTLILAAAVALLDRGGQVLRLYWSLWWFDIVMHFLGGLTVGLIAAWLYVFLLNKSSRRLVRMTLLSVLVVGILWEVYEVFIGINVTHEPYAWDTTIDIIMDLFGALLAGRYVKSLLEKPLHEL